VAVAAFVSKDSLDLPRIPVFAVNSRDGAKEENGKSQGSACGDRESHFHWISDCEGDELIWIHLSLPGRDSQQRIFRV
jgi:hypothetical protein